MAKRIEADKSKYLDRNNIPARDAAPPIYAIAPVIPKMLASFDKSMIKQAQEKPDWSLYKIELRDNNPFVVREMCDRCGKVFIVPRWRKIRAYKDDTVGTIYLESGVCKDCINASVYVDKYLDGDVLSESDAKNLFYSYSEDYERAWRMVIAAAPREAMTEQEWQHRCKFFQGCAICGGRITVQARFFPKKLNGEFTAWNVIPLCDECMNTHYRGRLDISKKTVRFKVFSTHTMFQKTKTIRLYLLHEMEKHGIYMEPLAPWRKRFFETKVLPGSD